MALRSVSIIGCGSIGGILSNYMDRGEAGDTELRGLFDQNEDKPRKIVENLDSSPITTTDIDRILEDEDTDIVVEAASQRAVSEYAEDVLGSCKDLVVLSIGAFSDQDLLERVREEARKSGKQVYLPSGAILGLDGVQAASIAGFDEAILKTSKPPKTLSKTKFVKENDLDLSNLEGSEAIFEGPASEAVKAFPSSVNVAASLSLAGVGFDETMVKVVADPSLEQNVHEIKVRGEAGEFTTRARNFPSPENPKTSYLAALSAIRTLRNLTGTIWIGA